MSKKSRKIFLTRMDQSRFTKIEGGTDIVLELWSDYIEPMLEALEDIASGGLTGSAPKHVAHDTLKRVKLEDKET